VSDPRRTLSRKVNGTPMKMLIDQEMSKEGEFKHNPPNVVAKLMGLDALPQAQPDSAAQRNHAKGYSRRSLSHSGIPFGSWECYVKFIGVQNRTNIKMFMKSGSNLKRKII